jgi:hypothetical protein
MKSRVLAVLFSAVSLAQPQKITPQKVIDDYVRAVGGAKVLTQIQTATIAGSLNEESTGKSGSFSLIVKSPNRFYSEIIVEPDRDVDAYNGMSAWGQDFSEGVHTLTGDAAKQAAAAGRYWNGRLADLKKDKLIVELAGIEPVRGRDAYHIHAVLGPGVSRELFFDTKTHLMVRETSTAEQFDYDDYRLVHGIQTPYQIELHKGGHDYRISVTRADFNSPVENSVFDFPKAAGIPLPDMKALFLDLSKNQKALEEIQRQYTWHMTSEEQETDSKGQTKPKTIREVEMFPIAGGGTVGHLIAKDGKPLSGDEKKKEDQRFNKQFEERTRQQAKKQAELAADPKKQAKQDEKQEADIADFLRFKRFTNPRRERFRGQEVLAFDFGANPDYKAKSIEDRLVQNLVGVMLIDEQAHEVVRLEAHMADTFKVAGGLVGSVDRGSGYVFEQTKVNNEVWLPSYAEVHAAMRLLVVKEKVNVIIRFSDYKKFNAESKVVAVQE